MTPQDFPSFIEPPIPSSRQRSLIIFDPPEKVTKKRNEEDLISPYRPTKRRKGYDFSESSVCRKSKSRCTSRKGAKKPAKTRKKKPQDDLESFGDGGGFSDGGGDYHGRGDYHGGGDYHSSPEKCIGVKDVINWSVTGEEVEMLKVEVVPIYWEALLGSPNSVIRVTERLYILRDWDRSGFLMVTPAITSG